MSGFMGSPTSITIACVQNSEVVLSRKSTVLLFDEVCERERAPHATKSLPPLPLSMPMVGSSIEPHLTKQAVRKLMLWPDPHVHPLVRLWQGFTMYFFLRHLVD